MRPAAEGDLQMTLHDPVDGRYTAVRIDRADPLVRIAMAVVADIYRGNGPRFTRLDDNVITIEGSNRRVVYRLVDGSWRPADDTCLMAWPD